MTTAVRVKNDVDAIVLGNTLALEGGLNVMKDSIFREPIDQSTKLYVNLLGVAEANKMTRSIRNLVNFTTYLKYKNS